MIVLKGGKQRGILGQLPHRAGGGVGGGVMAGGSEDHAVGDRAHVFHRLAIDLGVGDQACQIVARRATTCGHDRRKIFVELIEHQLPGARRLGRIRQVSARSTQIWIGPAEQPLGESQNLGVIFYRHADHIEHHLQRKWRRDVARPVDFAIGGLKHPELSARDAANAVAPARHTMRRERLKQHAPIFLVLRIVELHERAK